MIKQQLNILLWETPSWDISGKVYLVLSNCITWLGAGYSAWPRWGDYSDRRPIAVITIVLGSFSVSHPRSKSFQAPTEQANHKLHDLWPMTKLFVNTVQRTFDLMALVTTKSANANCTALRVWNVKRKSFLLGVGAFRPKFYGNGVISCQNVDTVR